MATEHDTLVAIVAALAESHRHEQVGPIAAVAAAERAAVESGADVVVVEVLTPACLDALSAPAAAAPTVVVSHLPPEQALLRCVAAGVRGFVWRPHAAERLDEVVALVAAGETCLESFSLEWLARSRRNGSTPDVELPARQAEVLRLVGEGMSNPEIARALGMSLNSVKTHLQRAMRKLGVRDRREAAALASMEAAPGPPAKSRKRRRGKD